MNKLKREKAITLISLVITIILLLILAGVTLNIVFNEGLIGKSQTAVDTYSEQSARERLEIELVNMMGEKVTNKNYNKDGFLTEKLQNAGFIVNENIVIVDGWQFEIDRSVPKIGLSLGKGEENKNIKIDVGEVAYSTDGTTATVTCTISYEGTIKSIIIGGKSVSVPEKVDGKYVVNLEYKENKTVGIMVKDENDNYALSNVEISKLTEDMVIKTAEDLKTFRDMVNAGRTFENRKVSLKNSINLNENSVYSFDYENGTFSYTGAEPENWVVIGNETNRFKGTFDGEYNTISNLYLDSNQYQYAGMFGINEGIIKNLILKNVYINNTYSVQDATYTGGVSGNCIGTIQNIGVEEGFIKGYNSVSSSHTLWYSSRVGGISGSLVGNIKDSYNKSIVCGQTLYQNCKSVYVGGIVGISAISSSIVNTYNCGKVYSNSYLVFSGGIVGNMASGSIAASYSYGEIVCQKSKLNYSGGIIGRKYANGTIDSNVFCSEEKYTYSYYNYNSSNNTYSSSVYGRVPASEIKCEKLNTDAWCSDLKDSNEKWIYNNGYPILKWQVRK